MKIEHKRYKFTLIEVVVAIAILALGILSAMSMVSFSVQRIERSHDDWQSKHMLSQAAEYYLLCGSSGQIPQNFFPYQGYSAYCQIGDCSNLQSIPSNNGGLWKLSTYDISVRGPSGEIVSEIKIDKMCKNALSLQ